MSQASLPPPAQPNLWFLSIVSETTQPDFWDYVKRKWRLIRQPFGTVNQVTSETNPSPVSDGPSKPLPVAIKTTSELNQKKRF